MNAVRADRETARLLRWTSGERLAAAVAAAAAAAADGGRRPPATPAPSDGRTAKLDLSCFFFRVGLRRLFSIHFTIRISGRVFANLQLFFAECSIESRLKWIENYQHFIASIQGLSGAIQFRRKPQKQSIGILNG